MVNLGLEPGFLLEQLSIGPFQSDDLFILLLIFFKNHIFIICVSQDFLLMLLSK